MTAQVLAASILVALWDGGVDADLPLLLGRAAVLASCGVLATAAVDAAMQSARRAPRAAVLFVSVLVATSALGLPQRCLRPGSAVWSAVRVAACLAACAAAEATWVAEAALSALVWAAAGSRKGSGLVEICVWAICFAVSRNRPGPFMRFREWGGGGIPGYGVGAVLERWLVFAAIARGAWFFRWVLLGFAGAALLVIGVLIWTCCKWNRPRANSLRGQFRRWIR